MKFFPKNLGLAAAFCAAMGLNSANAQNSLQWASTTSSIGNESWVLSTKVDAVGNVYSSGFFYGTIDFDPSTATVELTSNGFSDLFVAKFDNEGALLWVKSIGGANYEEFGGFHVNPDGSFYWSATMYDEADLDPDPAVEDLVSPLGADAYFLHCNADGEVLWKKVFSGDLDEYASSITSNAAGDVFFMLNTNFCVDMNPGGASAAEVCISETATNQFVVAKYSSSGVYAWSKTYTAAGEAFGQQLVADNSGNVLAAGVFYNQIYFSETTPSVCAGVTDVFTVKIDGSGSTVWANTFGAEHFEYVNGLAVNENDDYLLGGWYKSNSFDIDPGTGVKTLTNSSTDATADVFLAKFDKNGLLLWANTIGTNGDQAAMSVAFDANGDAAMCGYFYNDTDFDPSASEAIGVSGGMANAFLASYDASTGDYSSFYQVEGASGHVAHSVSYDALNNWYLGGRYLGEVDFDPTASTVSAATDTWSCFVLKYGSESATAFSAKSFDTQVLAYPNPSKGQVSVHLGKVYEGLNLRVFNAQGSLVAVKTLGDAAQFNLDLVGENGLYLLELQDGEGRTCIIRVVKN